MDKAFQLLCAMNEILNGSKWNEPTLRIYFDAVRPVDPTDLCRAMQVILARGDAMVTPKQLIDLASAMSLRTDSAESKAGA